MERWVYLVDNVRCAFPRRTRFKPLESHFYCRTVGGAVSLSVKGTALGMAQQHRQGLLRAGQCLDLRLLIHREEDSVVGWVDGETDGIIIFSWDLLGG